MAQLDQSQLKMGKSETWETTKKENKETNQILDNILKRLLKVQNSTPREALYIETGIVDIEHTRKKTQNRNATKVRQNQKQFN